jgi:hypothetical protein
MTDWERARVTLQHILREPGALPPRAVELLRVAVLPQLDAALALDCRPAFLPDAVAAVGPDPELARAEAQLRAGLAALV